MVKTMSFSYATHSCLSKCMCAALQELEREAAESKEYRFYQTLFGVTLR